MNSDAFIDLRWLGVVCFLIIAALSAVHTYPTFARSQHPTHHRRLQSRRNGRQ